MAEKRFAVSRRAFLKGSTLSVAALALSDRALDPVWQGLTKLGVPTPWYRQSPIKTTYNYCDMCPWRCGVIVQSVNGRVVKIDGNPKDPKSRGMLCARGQAGVADRGDERSAGGGGEHHHPLARPHPGRPAPGRPAARAPTMAWVGSSRSNHRISAQSVPRPFRANLPGTTDQQRRDDSKCATSLRLSTW